MRGFIDYATPEDFADVAANLTEDAKAVFKDFGQDPLVTMTEASHISNVRAIVVGDHNEQQCVGIFGWYDIGYLWLVLTPDLFKHIKLFRRMLKPVIKDILQQTGILFCYIDESQKHHVRFARWLGFTPNLKLEGTNYTTYGRTT